MALGHSPQIVTQGLVFYIDPSNSRSYAGFGNTIYNMVNSSIGGTFVNFTANPIDNTGNRSIFFDNASNNVLLIPSSNLQFGASDFTIQFWFKFPGYANNIGKTIFSDSWGPSNGGFLFYTFQNGANEKILFYSTSTDGSWNIALEKDLIVSPSFNTWYNVAVTRNGNLFTLYSNGQAVNTFSSSLSLRNTGLPYSFGASPTASTASKCSIGSVMIYKNKGLSATEILQNYNTTRKKYYPEERIVTDSLILNIDSGNRNSYPGTGNQIYDLSGSGNTGTLSSNPVFSSLNGGQLGFNGTSQYITFGNKFSFTTENFSFSYWVFVNTYTTNRAGQGPVVFYKGNFNENGYYSQIGSDGSFGFTTNGSSNPSTSSGAGVVKLKYWHHISIVRNGSSVKLYCDGLDVTSSAATHSPAVSNRDFLIANYNNFIFANIQISQFQIYNRALTQQEVQQNYNATKNRFLNALPPVNDGSLSYFIDPGDVRTYPGTGNTIYNLVTSGFGGTIVGGVTYSGIGGTANFTFNGTNGWINIGNRPAKTTGSTISFFVKTTTTSQSFMVVCTTDGGVYINRFNTSGQILAFFDTSTGNNTSADISTVSINDGRWHYVTATTNRSTTSMYIDGIFNKSYSETASTLTSTNNLIGGSSLESNWFAGSIGIVQIHDRALSAVEIKQNFDYYRTRYGI